MFFFLKVSEKISNYVTDKPCLLWTMCVGFDFVTEPSKILRNCFNEVWYITLYHNVQSVLANITASVPINSLIVQESYDITAPFLGFSSYEV